MDEYSQKGTGEQRPPVRRPPQKKPDNSGWYSWPIIIVLFALGIWPIALVLLFINIFGDEKRKKQPASQRKPSAEARMEQAVEDAVERAKAKVSVQISATSEKKGEAAGKTEKNGKSGKKAKSSKKAQKQEAKAPGKLLRVIGLCLLASGLIVGIDAIPTLIQGYTYILEDLFAGMGMVAAGGIMWGRGQYLANMFRRSQRYILAIGDAETMPLSEIAKRVNRSEKKAAKELQRLIDKGYLGEDAYIDHDRGYFLRFGATVEEETPAAPPPKEAEEGYSGILRSIRRANDRIADEELSRKIDRLEQISALIFKEVEEHPEKRDRIRTFFDYYLPTTQKLLDAYAEFEETGVEGEHLGQAKDRIEETMDAIVEGFEHQLDELYSADAMDVFSDIKVMETMLHRDTASAAKDFGYTERPKVRPKADAARAAGQSGNQTAAAPVETSSGGPSAAASAAQAAPTAQPEAEDDGGVQQLRL